jgi:CubicO group peptidase (beta-lactamase class C family)
MTLHGAPWLPASIRLSGLTAAAALLLAAPLAAQAHAPARNAGRLVAPDSVTRVIPARMRELGVPGASVTVIRGGKVVLSRGFGLADVELAVPGSNTTRYRVGSIAKSFTAMAIGILVDEGKLDLDAEVQRYVPTFPRKPWPVTVRELAGHLSGIRHYGPGEFENQRYYPTLLEGLTMFQADSLLFEPGTQFGYSSFGYNLLGAVIEAAGGVPYLQFMKQRVFLPLGMTATVPDFADSVIVNRANFYVGPDSGTPLLNAPYVDVSYKWPSGGFLSTTDDLARFGQAMLDGKLLKPATRDLLWTPMHTNDGKSTGYGIGWNIQTDSLGRRRIFHTGGSMGAISILAVYPEQRLVVAITDNSDHSLNALAARLAAWYAAAAKAGGR